VRATNRELGTVPRRCLLASLLLAIALCAAAGCAPPPPRPPEPPRWSDADAVAALRTRLRSRGYAAEVTAGPMVAGWDELAPASPLASEPAIPRLARADGPGAWLVMTQAGGWWVWEATDEGPLSDPPAVSL
jgi:hypothetical protein